MQGLPSPSTSAAPLDQEKQEAQGEAFDLYDADGTSLGRCKARSAVHRDGDWHRSLHLWVLLEGGTAPLLVLQRRSHSKDTWPGAIDISVTGHYRAGDDLAGALREAHEELGLEVHPSQTLRLGTRFRVDTSRPPVLDREIQDILLLRTHARPFELRPDAQELAGLLLLELEAADLLLLGLSDAAVPALELRSASEPLRPVQLRSSELVGSTDGYPALAWSRVRAHLAGGAPEPFVLRPAG